MSDLTVHLIDGTYELFRHYYALPSKIHLGKEVSATRGAIRSIVSLMFNPPIDKGPATHIGITTDQLIESFRNKLYSGYKDGRDTPEDLKPQFDLLEEGIDLAGFKLWTCTDYEADDALASAAYKFNQSEQVKRVLIHTADKDLLQCLTPDNKITQYDRRHEKHYLYKDVSKKFGVDPESIPDYLALVGDKSDCIPGLPGFGPKASSTLLQKYKFIENIPKEIGLWDISLRGAERLGKTFKENYEDAILFKKLTTLVKDVSNIGSLKELEWSGTKPGFEKFCEDIAAPDIYKKLENH